MEIRPTKKRVSYEALGIEDETSTRLIEAMDDDGVIDLAVAFDPPSQSPTEGRVAVTDALVRKGFVNEEELYRKEFLLKGAHTLIIHGASTTQIAQKLGITAKEARELKKELTARQINEVRTLDKNKVAGQALMFYDTIMSKALQMAGNTAAGPRNQIEGLKVALQAQTDKQKFLGMAGYWNSGLNGNGDAHDEHYGGAADVRNMMDAVLTGGTYEVVDTQGIEDDDIELL